jgi:cystathionine beta-synthase
MNSHSLPPSDSLRVYDDISQTVGKTPLVRLARIGRGLPCPIYAKVEFFNPCGSVKDRIALNIIEEAERSGRLKPGGTIVEATSGNTGLGLAMVSAQKGYKTIFVMPDKMSQEKIQLLRAFGAKVVITPTAVEPEDPRSYYSVADRLVTETPNAILANQYHNPENPRSHYQTTGPEIWQQTGGLVTDILAGMGTGGTISGAGQYLKEQNPAIRMVGVDVVGSLLLETWQRGSLPDDVQAHSYKVEGIGEDFLPSTLDLSILDNVIRVNDKESFLWARRLVKEEGIFAGGSSGAVIAAAVRYAQTLTPDDLIVVILPDSGSRYLSKFYDDQWARENGFLSSEWSDSALGDILTTKPVQGLITARITDRITDVIAQMKQHDISQMPVLYPDGQLGGVVTEINLLKHLLDNRTHPPDETISSIVVPVRTIFPVDTPIENVLPMIMEGQVVLVVEQEQPVGILTKIDVLDYIAQGI